ncbi:MAG TPA: selenocysteine-specific translation elongation factor [Candidatus Nitrosotalea sp.]|nr:selenocysteine-specific translation elongation factor [Candidatus Nitrosotalea sp.]
MGFVIGTAGHVDHGKSALVQALSGIDPDRLAEEKRRGLTIDLGFAHATLPSGREVGIVDVPGHIDFMRNLLSGMHGVDFALLIVSATEGVMAQTREHLEVLDLMGIDHGLDVITKVDLADAELIELVSEEAREASSRTSLAGAEVVHVSARTGLGMEQLRQQIDSGLKVMTPRPDKGRPRLAIDRAFAMTGFGTVVTGTLVDGCLQVGQELELQPGGTAHRVRGLEQYNRPVESAEPGSRVAVNIAGIQKDAIRRGQVLTLVHSLQPSERIDASVRLLPGTRRLRPGAQAIVHSGSASVSARLLPLESSMPDPGGTGWLQLRLRHPIAAVNGDRYILSEATTGAVVGGGVFVDVHPVRHPRNGVPVIESLAQRLTGSGLEQELRKHPFGVTPSQIMVITGASAADLEDLNAERVGPYLFDPGVFAQLSAAALREVERYHATHPMRRGVPAQELRSRLRVPPPVFRHVVAALLGAGVLAEHDLALAAPSHRVLVDERLAAALIEALSANPMSPPPLSAALKSSAVSSDVAEALIEQATLVRIGADLAITRSGLDRAMELIRSELESAGSISLGRLRDLMGGNRRTAQAILEYLDGVGETRRVGDERVRRT